MSYSLAFTQSLYMMLYVAGKVERGQYEFIPTQVISQELNIPPSTAGMILRRLNRAGLMETREGANGGVRLSMAADEVTLLDIFSAIEQERPLFQLNVTLGVSGEKATKAQQTIADTLDSVELNMKR